MHCSLCLEHLTLDLCLGDLKLILSPQVQWCNLREPSMLTPVLYPSLSFHVPPQQNWPLGDLFLCVKPSTSVCLPVTGGIKG